MKYTKTNTTIITTKIHLQNFSAGPVTSHNVETLSTIITRDVGPIKPTKPDIMTKNLVFGSFLHKLCWLIMQNMSDTTTELYRLFRNIKIYNIKSSWCTKLKQTAKNQIEPQAPRLVVPFLIIFSFWTTQKCILLAISPSLPTRYQGCPAKYALWAKENSYSSREWSKTSF